MGLGDVKLDICDGEVKENPRGGACLLLDGRLQEGALFMSAPNIACGESPPNHVAAPEVR